MYLMARFKIIVSFLVMSSVSNCEHSSDSGQNCINGLCEEDSTEQLNKINVSTLPNQDDINLLGPTYIESSEQIVNENEHQGHDEGVSNQFHPELSKRDLWRDLKQLSLVSNIHDVPKMFTDQSIIQEVTNYDSKRSTHKEAQPSTLQNKHYIIKIPQGTTLKNTVQNTIFEPIQNVEGVPTVSPSEVAAQIGNVDTDIQLKQLSNQLLPILIDGSTDSVNNNENELLGYATTITESSSNIYPIPSLDILRYKAFWDNKVLNNSKGPAEFTNEKLDQLQNDKVSSTHFGNENRFTNLELDNLLYSLQNLLTTYGVDLLHNYLEELESTNGPNLKVPYITQTSFVSQPSVIPNNQAIQTMRYQPSGIYFNPTVDTNMLAPNLKYNVAPALSYMKSLESSISNKNSLLDNGHGMGAEIKLFDTNQLITNTNKEESIPLDSIIAPNVKAPIFLGHSQTIPKINFVAKSKYFDDQFLPTTAIQLERDINDFDAAYPFELNNSLELSPYIPHQYLAELKPTNNNILLSLNGLNAGPFICCYSWPQYKKILIPKRKTVVRYHNITAPIIRKPVLPKMTSPPESRLIENGEILHTNISEHTHECEEHSKESRKAQICLCQPAHLSTDESSLENKIKVKDLLSLFLKTFDVKKPSTTIQGKQTRIESVKRFKSVAVPANIIQMADTHNAETSKMAAGNAYGAYYRSPLQFIEAPVNPVPITIPTLNRQESILIST